MDCDTSYSHFRETLEKYSHDGYRFVTPPDYFAGQVDGKRLLMRHDIDKYPDKALELAQIEHDLGIAATYFVRVHCNYYNPFGFETYDHLRRIPELGHALSLHSDAYDFARIFGLDPLDIFEREVAVFKAVFGRDVTCFAPHRTHNSSRHEDRDEFHHRLRQKGYRNVYEIANDPKWKYLSDSSGAWVEGCFCRHLGRWEKIMVLIHPEWWYRNHIELEGSLV